MYDLLPSEDTLDNDKLNKLYWGGTAWQKVALSKFLELLSQRMVRLLYNFQ